MVKFLTRKGLLSLISFQAASPDDTDYAWPEIYSGDVETLVGLLRQCPSYQVNHYHSHCGLRSKLLPALDYIKTCMEIGIGVKFGRSRGDWTNNAWRETRKSRSEKQAFWVTNEDGEQVDVGGEKTRSFNFAMVNPRATWGINDIGGERSARSLFTAEKWNWIREPEDNEKALKSRFMKADPSLN